MSFLRALLARVLRLLGFRPIVQWPRSIAEWRYAVESTEMLWKRLGTAVLRKHGLESWKYLGLLQLERPDDPLDNGYMRSGRLNSMTPVEGFNIHHWQYMTPLLRAVRCRKSGADFVCKVLVVGNDGKTGLFALRQALSGGAIFHAKNHILPLLREIHVDDITIGVFPMGSPVSMSDLIRPPPSAEYCSLDDLLHVVAQALEALVFLHEKRVAHRDAFVNNFMLEWMPDSLCEARRPLAAYPRVWLFDFETAIAFPPTTPRKDCVCSGSPFPNLPAEKYSRPIPAEILVEGADYNALELDIWQFTAYLRPLKCANERVDSVLGTMGGGALDAAEELVKVQEVLGEIPQNDLRVPYERITFARA